MNKKYKASLTLSQAFIFCFAPFAMAFILTCLYRTMNAVLLPNLTADLHLTSSESGLLTASFFLAYGLFQFPIGPLLDKYGPRRVKGSLLIIAAIGLGLSSFSKNISELIFAHFLIGIGASGGLIAGFKMIVQWFPPKKIALVNALMMTSGGIGILLGTAPTDMLNQMIGWQGVNLIYALVTLITSLIIFIIVPETSIALEKLSLKENFLKVALVYKSTFFWQLAPLVAFFLGTFMAFQSLWIESWMRNVDKYQQVTTDLYLLTVGVGITVGVLSTGYLFSFIKRLRISTSQMIIVLSLTCLTVESLILKKVFTTSYIIWFLFGFFTQLFNIVFAIYANFFPKEYSGRVNSAQNILTYFIVFLTQYIMGVIIGIGKIIPQQQQIEINHQHSFLLLMIMQIFALLWFIFFKKIIKKGISEIRI